MSLHRFTVCSTVTAADTVNHIVNNDILTSNANERDDEFELEYNHNANDSRDDDFELELEHHVEYKHNDNAQA